MKPLLVLALTLNWLITPQTASVPPPPITAPTRPPVLLESRPGVMYGMTEEEYRKIAAQLAKFPAFVSMKRKPTRLSASARFGFNLSFGGHNRSWVLDGDATHGYVLYADLNANGDLTDDRPLKFQNKGGTHVLLYKGANKETINGREMTYPIELKLEVAMVHQPGHSTPTLSIEIYDQTFRTGTVRVNGRDIAFGLLGSQGRYDNEFSQVYFDTNGDGRLDRETPDSPEGYAIKEKYVNLGEVSYEFSVDRYGRSLTLKPLAERLPDRAALLPGKPAPDFTFTDPSGTTHRLSDYRGKVVLLDFWGSWCVPCVAEMPRLVALYAKLRAQGFEIISVDSGDELAHFQEFIAAQGMTWPQTREDPSAGALHRLFRVQSFPAHFLFDKDGTILANGIKSEDLSSVIEKHLSAQ